MFYICRAPDIAVAGEGDRGETQHAYDNYLRMWAENERQGFDGVFLSEHHFGMGLSPSPHLLLAALSQRTTRMRLGVMSTALPLHDVRRVVEEFGMLDYLSHGRLEIGIGPGAGTLEATVSGLDPADVRPRYASGADVVDQYLSGSLITHQDAFVNLVDVPVGPQMRQDRPTVWVTATSEGSFRWAAARGYKVCTSWLPTADVAALNAAYHEAAAESGRRSGAADLGVRRRVFVAPSDAEAEDIVARADDALRTGREPLLFRRANAGGASASRPTTAASSRMNEPADIIVGSPRTVIERLTEQVMTAGIGHVLFFTDFKRFDLDDLARCHELIGQHVIPALKHLQAPGAPGGEMAPCWNAGSSL